MRHTRFKNLGYMHTSPGWRFVDLSDDSKNLQPAVIGSEYATEKELLADVQRFAEDRGFADSRPPDETVIHEGWAVVTSYDALGEPPVVTCCHSRGEAEAFAGYKDTARRVARVRITELPDTEDEDG